jgi:hypothetical protein
MSVNYEIKGILARLLATEDLLVEHKTVQTASFNVNTRVLTLPMWEKASSNVYDLLVGHEVGHALETPTKDWMEITDIPKDFVNVVEDVRIEKLIKRRYPGISKSFFIGYKELYDEDFFSLENKEINDMNLADRVNLHFKIGNFIRLNFSCEEKDIVDLIASAETFDEVLYASKVLYEYCKKESKEKSSKQETNSENTTKSDSLTGAFDEDNSQDSQDHEESKENGSSGNDPKVETMESFEESIKKLLSEIQKQETVYVEVPKIDLKNVIIDNITIHNTCSNFWNNLSDNHKTYINRIDSRYRDFKTSAQKEVNYLVKEFECRKAADSYSRSLVSPTGVLDCSKIHMYKFNDDIFKKITNVTEGKNHGLIFILDWSGSMGKVLLDTIKQLYNLIWFCKKVSIPFEVYAFTEHYPIANNTSYKIRPNCYTKIPGIFCIDPRFSLMNLFTSKVNSLNLEIQMKNIYRVCMCINTELAPPELALSSTPLNEALICLHEIIPIFKKQNKIQKVQCVVLTDGDSSQLFYHRQFNRKWETEPYIGTSRIDSVHSVFLRDRKIGKTYLFPKDTNYQTDTILKNLVDKFSDTSFIGIRVLDSLHSGSFIRKYCDKNGNEYTQAMSSWKKEKSFCLFNSAYHVYFGIGSSNLSESPEFNVSSDATKREIKSAFMNSLKTKRNNKKILNEFIKQIA